MLGQYLIIVCLVGVCGALRTLPLTSYGFISPSSVQVKLGQPIVLNCTLHPNVLRREQWDSMHLLFLHRDKKEPIDRKLMRKIDEYTMQMRIPRAGEGDLGEYSCLIWNEKEFTFLVDSAVVVNDTRIDIKLSDYPIKDFTCKYYYKRKLRCSWSQHDENFRVNGSRIIYGLHLLDGSSRHNCGKHIWSEESSEVVCLWTEHTKPPLIHRSKYQFELFSYPESPGNVFTQSFELNLSSIVILNPPENLDFYPENSTLAWDYPNEIDSDLELFPLVKVMIQASSNKYPVNELINASHTETYKSLKLYQDTSYNLTVWSRIIDGINSRWSRGETIEVETIPDVPLYPPKTHPKSYQVMRNGSSYNVKVYWKKPIEEEVWFHISVDIDGKWLDFSTKELSYTIRNLTDQSFQVRVYSANRFGLSRTFSLISVDRMDEVHWSESSNKKPAYSMPSVSEVSTGKPPTSKPDCEVPFPIAKFHQVDIEPYGPYSILVTWRFRCELERSRMSKFLILYSPKQSKRRSLNHNEPPKLKRLEFDHLPENNQIVLTNLTPHTEYKLMISADNVLEKYQDDVETDTEHYHLPVPVGKFVNSFRNVPEIDHFRIRLWDEFNRSKTVEPKYRDCKWKERKSVCSIKLDGLEPFEDYLADVSACPMDGTCWHVSDHPFRTPPTRPGPVTDLSAKRISSQSFMINFARPRLPNGPIDFYYLESDVPLNPNNFSGDPPIDIQVQCDSWLEEKQFEVKIIPVNVLNGTDRFVRQLYGQAVSVQLTKMCILEHRWTYFWSSQGLVLFALVLLVATCLICRSCRRRKRLAETFRRNNAIIEKMKSVEEEEEAGEFDDLMQASHPYEKISDRSNSNDSTNSSSLATSTSESTSQAESEESERFEKPIIDGYVQLLRADGSVAYARMENGIQVPQSNQSKPYTTLASLEPRTSSAIDDRLMNNPSYSSSSSNRPMISNPYTPVAELQKPGTYSSLENTRLTTVSNPGYASNGSIRVTSPYTPVDSLLSNPFAGKG